MKTPKLVGNLGPEGIVERTAMGEGLDRSPFYTIWSLLVLTIMTKKKCGEGEGRAFCLTTASSDQDFFFFHSTISFSSQT